MIDVTLTTQILTAKVAKWKVLSEHLLSDHRYIIVEVGKYDKISRILESSDTLWERYKDITRTNLLTLKMTKNNLDIETIAENKKLASYLAG